MSAAAAAARSPGVARLKWEFAESDCEADDDVCVPGSFTEQHHAKAEYRVEWRQRPERALVLAKRHADEAELQMAYAMCAEVGRAGVEVLLASPLYEQIAARLREAGLAEPRHWHPADAAEAPQEQPDFVTTIGGDGLLLYANTLFQSARPPPVVAFTGGSLGFLAPFEKTEFRKTLGSLLAMSRWPVSLRMRLRCQVVDTAGRVRARHEVLNEAVVDRGSSPFLSAVEFYCNDEHLTTVQADGLIVATPTGSTAYSLAAGGPMLHPSVQGILFTPICPHSLSFRPMVFANSAKLRCTVASEARTHAWVTVDGRKRLRPPRGESLLIEASPFPLPTILAEGNTADWFEGLRSSFNFNTRARQKPLTEAAGLTADAAALAAEETEDDDPSRDPPLPLGDQAPP